MPARCWIAGLLLVAVAAPAPAGYVITFGPADIQPGGQTTVDVTIAETGPTPALDYFLAVFRLTPVGPAPAGGVAFADPQTTPFGPAYVFATNSGGLTRDVTQSGAVLTVGDVSDNGGTAVGAGKLLARLDLSAVPVLAVGSAYTLELVADESQFQDAALNDIEFTSAAVTVTAIPEPGSLALAGAAAGVLLTRIRRRGRPAGRRPQEALVFLHARPSARPRPAGRGRTC